MKLATSALIGSAFCLAPPPAEALSCGFEPPPDALVETGRSAFDEDLEVRVDGSGDTARCYATLRLLLSKLPSRSQVPRPRELASELVPVAHAYGAAVCRVVVWVEDDTGDAASEEDDPDACWHGTFRYDGDFWRTEEEDATCW